MPAVVRRLAALLVVLATLSPAATASAGIGDQTIDRGIVQSVSATQIVLRELDGTSVPLAVDSSTRVQVNGFPARLADIRPGFVAAVFHNGSQPARGIRAFGRVDRIVDRGLVAAASAGEFTLRRVDGTLLTLRITPRTRVRLNGLATTPAAIRPGQHARVTHTPDGQALLVQLVGRRRP